MFYFRKTVQLYFVNQFEQKPLILRYDNQDQINGGWEINSIYVS